VAPRLYESDRFLVFVPPKKKTILLCSCSMRLLGDLAHYGLEIRWGVTTVTSIEFRFVLFEWRKQLVSCGWVSRIIMQKGDRNPFPSLSLSHTHTEERNGPVHPKDREHALQLVPYPKQLKGVLPSCDTWVFPPFISVRFF
jgi:hypothetical protein